MIFSDRKVVTMGKENLQRNAAINITKNIRKQIMETYEKNNIPKENTIEKVQEFINDW